MRRSKCAAAKQLFSTAVSNSVFPFKRGWNWREASAAESNLRQGKEVKAHGLAGITILQK